MNSNDVKPKARKYCQNISKNHRKRQIKVDWSRYLSFPSLLFLSWFAANREATGPRVFDLLRSPPVLSLSMIYQQVCNKSKMTGAACAHELLYPSGERAFIPGFTGVRVVFYRLLFVLLSFLFSSLCCLSFFYLRSLITPLVSSLSY